MSFGQAMKTAAAYGQDLQLHVTYGELTTYYPESHTAKFNLPAHPDPDTLQPYEVGPLQVGTMFTGPAFGLQFPLEVGAQALIIYVDLGRIYPVAAVLLCNDVQTPPFPDGKTSGWIDNAGNVVKTVNGGNPHAAIVSPQVELGAEGLDTSLDAVVTVRHFNAWIAAEYALHIHSGVQGGPGTTAQPTTSQDPTGSSQVQAAP